MKITSTPPRDPYDFILDDWAMIPIDHQSTICPAHVSALPIGNFKQLLGQVTDKDWDRAIERYMAFFCYAGDKLSTRQWVLFLTR